MPLLDARLRRQSHSDHMIGRTAAGPRRTNPTPHRKKHGQRTFPPDFFRVRAINDAPDGLHLPQHGLRYARRQHALAPAVTSKGGLCVSAEQIPAAQPQARRAQDGQIRRKQIRKKNMLFCKPKFAVHAKKMEHPPARAREHFVPACEFQRGRPPGSRVSTARRPLLSVIHVTTLLSARCG